MLPYSDDFISPTAKKRSDFAVMLPIPLKLLSPILAPANRREPAFSTAMPKATVNKNCDAVGAKSEIWTPRNFQMTAPTFNFEITKELTET